MSPAFPTPVTLRSGHFDPPRARRAGRSLQRGALAVIRVTLGPEDGLMAVDRPAPLGGSIPIDAAALTCQPFRALASSSRLPPERALAAGRWVKLIAGASNQDLVAIEDLVGIYALAGVHCVDVAADGAVVSAARRGIAWARQRHGEGVQAPGPWRAPWLMVSLSDGEDPHFRKAWFDPLRCPPTCSRPCERICPALAIPPSQGDASGAMGILEDRCYGCGRCLPACPLGLIEERQQLLPPPAVAPLLADLQPDAVELHTSPGRAGAFFARVAQLQASGLPLARVGVSCGLEGHGASPEGLSAELWQRYAVLRQAGFAPLWQLDGRPMSGDVGAGTAHAAIRLLEQVAPLAPPGPLQLAGGTNGHSIERLHRCLGHQDRVALAPVAGIAFGGVARRLLQPFLLEAEQRRCRLLEEPPLWTAALVVAQELVGPWLCRATPPGG